MFRPFQNLPPGIESILIRYFFSKDIMFSSTGGSVGKQWSAFKLNWKAGLAVSLVSVPLSIAIAIASGASPIAGIITAVWAGIIASIFASSNYNIMGPAGALTAILAAASLQFGAGALSTIALLAGIFILGAWLLKLDRYISYIPSSVIHGFTLSVAIVIAFSQLNFAFGIVGLPKHAHFAENVMETLRNLHLANPATVALFLGALILMFALLRIVPKVPGAVVIAPLGILLGWASQVGWLPFGFQLLQDVYPNLSLSIFSIPRFAFSSALIIPALTVALVAIIETELSAKIAGGMTKTRHDARKEMFGLALANIGAGFFGGLPASGVFVRTALNVRSHATSKLSQGLNAIFVAVISLLVLNLFSYIPMAAIAAILIFAAIRMVETHHFKKFATLDKLALITALIVTAVSVYEDAMVGILVGTVISLVVLVERISRGQFELVMHNDQEVIDRIIGAEASGHIQIPDHAQVCIYSIKGHLTYTNAFRHTARVRNTLSKCQTVILRLKELAYIDVDGLEAIDDMLSDLAKNNVRVIITGVSPFVAKHMKHSKLFQDVSAKGDVYAKAKEAMAAIGSARIS